jgi:hypothetical protein
MRSYTTTHATRTAHSTRSERMLSLLVRNNSSESARYVRVRPGTVALHAPEAYNSFKGLDAYHSLCRVSDVCVNDANTPPRPLPPQSVFKTSLQLGGRRREKTSEWKTEKTSRFCTTLTLYFCLFSTFIEKDALCHRPGQPVQWCECSLHPKAGRHDELGQAIIPPLIETQRVHTFNV